MVLMGLVLLVARVRCRRLWERLGEHTADARRARQHWLQASQQEFGRRKDEFTDWYHVIVEERENAIGRIEEIQSGRAEEIRIVTRRNWPTSTSGFPRHSSSWPTGGSSRRWLVRPNDPSSLRRSNRSIERDGRRWTGNTPNGCQRTRTFPAGIFGVEAELGDRLRDVRHRDRGHGHPL
ncbi:MAG: hypothetical protein CM1200mP2_47340 [Planctomycetaceae bacterium]|nr:MAG: hypothetical protein CM1200mP2_47340 [Planctomycetaceae bacterium]